MNDRYSGISLEALRRSRAAVSRQAGFRAPKVFRAEILRRVRETAGSRRVG